VSRLCPLRSCLLNDLLKSILISGLLLYNDCFIIFFELFFRVCPRRSSFESDISGHRCLHTLRLRFGDMVFSDWELSNRTKDIFLGRNKLFFEKIKESS
jgi:hypothetical protein